jgi:hypothetical protein
VWSGTMEMFLKHIGDISHVTLLSKILVCSQNTALNLLYFCFHFGFLILIKCR